MQSCANCAVVSLGRQICTPLVTSCGDLLNSKVHLALSEGKYAISADVQTLNVETFLFMHFGHYHLSAASDSTFLMHAESGQACSCTQGFGGCNWVSVKH